MKAIYPGSFDPVTNGHFDIIERSSRMFEELIVLVASNTSKESSFSVLERCDMLRQAIAGAALTNVKVDSFSEGLLVDYAQDCGAHVIMKGLRAVSDFDYEFQMALLNRHMKPDIETVFMMTRAEFSFLSSSIVREIARLGGEIGGLVPEGIAGKIVQILDSKKST